MASTAEELSSQAEQLQSAIAFFKLDELGARLDRHSVAIGSKSDIQATAIVGEPQQLHVKRIQRQPGNGKTNGNGVALYLDKKGNEEELDSEFERF
jgi:methyl-accepting chemotaxis protein